MEEMAKKGMMMMARSQVRWFLRTQYFIQFFIVVYSTLAMAYWADEDPNSNAFYTSLICCILLWINFLAAGMVFRNPTPTKLAVWVSMFITNFVVHWVDVIGVLNESWD